MISAVEALGITHTHSLNIVSLQKLGDAVETADQQIRRFLDFIYFLRENMKCRLSAQLLEDLQSEHYHLTLLVQYCLVKRVETQKPTASLEHTEYFLAKCESNRSVKVTKDDYTTHSQQLQEGL